jgi:hypothetical protein
VMLGMLATPKVRQPQFSQSVFGCCHSLVCVSPEPEPPTQAKNTREFGPEPSTKGDVCEHVCDLVHVGDEGGTDTSFSQAFLMKWYRRSICLLCSRNTGFLASAKADMLFTRPALIPSLGVSHPNSLSCGGNVLCFTR